MGGCGSGGWEGLERMQEGGVGMVRGGGTYSGPGGSRISGDATNRMRSDYESCTFPARSRGLRLQ